MKKNHKANEIMLDTPKDTIAYVFLMILILFAMLYVAGVAIYVVNKLNS